MSDQNSIFFIKVNEERVKTAGGMWLFFHNEGNASSFARNLSLAVAWQTNSNCYVVVEEVCRDEIMGTFWGDEYESANYNRQQQMFKEVLSSLTGAPQQVEDTQVKRPSLWQRILGWFE